MLQTTLARTPVSAESLDEILHTIQARDQRRELVFGDIISYYHDDEPNEVDVTVWHNLGRAAVCYFNGDSEWGDWNDEEQTILLDHPDADGLRVRLDCQGRFLHG
jgi:hypothetical protein